MTSAAAAPPASRVEVEPVPAAAGQRRRMVRPVGLAVAALATVVIAACGPTAPTAASPAATATSPAAPAPSGPHTLTGDLTVTGPTTGTDVALHFLNDICWTDYPFSDIVGGTAVVVRDVTGKALAEGKLKVGQKASANACRFPLAVTDVPASAAYQLQVGTRTPLQISGTDLEAAGWQVHLTLRP